MSVTVVVAKPANVLSTFWRCWEGRAGIFGSWEELGGDTPLNPGKEEQAWKANLKHIP